MIEVSNTNLASEEARRTFPKVSLSDLITEAQAGFATSERDPAGTIQVRMNNVTTEGTWDWSSFIRVPIDESSRSFFTLRAGDVLFNNTNSTELVGKTALFNKNDEPVVFSNHFNRLRTDKERLDPAYLAHWLLNLWKRGEFARICDKWIGQSAVQRDKLLALKIPLCPLPQQRRITERLRDQLAEVERARAAVEEQLKAAEGLPAAFLRAVFSSPTAQKWPRKRLAECCDLLAAKSIALSGDTEVQAITSACLTEWGFRTDGIKSARMWADDAKRAVAQPGEILIARSNTTELVGRASLFLGASTPVVASDLTIRLWPNTSHSGGFLAAFLSSLFVSGYWRDRAGGASSSMKKITRKQIENLPVPFPSFSEQQPLVTKMDAKLREAQALREQLAQKLASVEKLSAALLHEAFSGRV